MVGVVSHDGEKWVISYNDGIERIVPVYHKDVKSIDEELIKTLVSGVNFELIDEFTHPNLFYDVSWGEGTLCAKLILETIPKL
jgi:hypothetical protein